MSLVEKYPHPGPAPEKLPEGTGYTVETSKKHWAYADWVKRLRQHLIAQAVDALTSAPFTTPEQTIAAVLGSAYLEDSLSLHSPLAGLF